MNFGFSDEQELLRATARKFLENECTSAFVRQRMEEAAGVTDEFWAKLAEQGWLGLVYPEQYGGSGLGFVDLTVLMEEMGRVVMPGPYLSTVLLAGLTILEAGTAEQKAAWLPRIASGQAKAALAWAEPNARWDAPASPSAPSPWAATGCSTAPSSSSSTPIWLTSWSSWPAQATASNRSRG
jgi:alkylation response protein AidB-like acyl-CoA dehydrogenase